MVKMALQCRGGWLIPGLGIMIPHAVGQLSLQTTTTEACVLWSPQNTTAESVHCSERPRMMQLRPEANLKKKKKKSRMVVQQGLGRNKELL